MDGRRRGGDRFLGPLLLVGTIGVGLELYGVAAGGAGIWLVILGAFITMLLGAFVYAGAWWWFAG